MASATQDKAPARSDINKQAQEQVPQFANASGFTRNLTPGFKQPAGQRISQKNCLANKLQQ